MEEIGNAQAASVAQPPTPQGPTAEELAAKVAELERQSEGRLRDLQAERQKRQELETRMNQPVVQPVSPAANGAPQDELGRVLDPYLAPVRAKLMEAENFVRSTYEDKSMEYLSAKTGKSREAILEDKNLQEKLVGVAKRYGFMGNVFDVTKKAYEIMELENLRAAQAEQRRAATATNESGLPAGNPPPAVVGSRKYSQDDWSALPLAEYEKLSSQGTFTQDEDGKIVFKPNA